MKVTTKVGKAPKTRASVGRIRYRTSDFSDAPEQNLDYRGGTRIRVLDSRSSSRHGLLQAYEGENRARLGIRSRIELGGSNSGDFQSENTKGESRDRSSIALLTGTGCDVVGEARGTLLTHWPGRTIYIGWELDGLLSCVDWVPRSLSRKVLSGI